MDEASPHETAGSTGELVLYHTQDGRAQVHLRLAGGTVWLTQAEMAELFDATPQNIGQHIKHIHEDGELDPAATRKDYFQVRTEGSRQVQREVSIYNLAMILSVGYRVRSSRGTQFRYWATTVLREYLIKGFAMNDELVYAVTGHTAAELILKRIDVEAHTMGLTSWKGEWVRKGDVTVPKNYLAEPEISELNRLTTMFLDFAEDRARRRQQMTMADWTAQADRFLDFNERQVLSGPGSVSHAMAEEAAHGAFAEFDARRRAVQASAAEAEAEQDALAELERAQHDLEQRPPEAGQ